MQLGLECVDITGDPTRDGKPGDAVRNRYKMDLRRVDLNTSDATKLRERLPNVGAVKAEAIVQQRERLGGLRHVEDLFDIEGVGTSTVEDLLPFSTFWGAARVRRGS